jgi:phosphinothricin acetyltransferase
MTMQATQAGHVEVECTLERHGAQILAILNEAIANSTAIYDYNPRPESSMVAWFETKRAHDFPVLGLEGHDGRLLGFSTYGTFRAWPAYKYSVENSLYVRHDVRGQGIGDALLARLIAVAKERDVHVLVAGIDAANPASIALHEKHGFQHAGTLRECGFKFGRWLDLAFYQRTLATPEAPREDRA